MRKTLIIIFGLLCSGIIVAQKKVDVLIIGGGAGGTSAGIQAARMGADVQILEQTQWLGGMLTSAGVSAIDGNHNLPSGIWGEFRTALREHYGGAKALATGWVSHTLFEPSVGQAILSKMAQHPNLQITYGSIYESIIWEDDVWKVEYIQENKKYTTKAKVLIDATETGELLPLVGADFRLGMDAKTDTDETEAPDTANAVVQDLTYVAILEDAGAAKHKKGLVKKPKNYNPEAYLCACKREDGEMFGAVSGCDQMLNYGKLPNGKYMINWPNCGNDYYVNWPEISTAEKKLKIEAAKAFTQGFVYYIQSELGYRNLRLASEFPTRDKYPMIPYHREGRRAKGQTFLVVDHLERPYDFKLYRTGVAVGDYPIDHHHDKNPEAPEIDFINIKVPSYSIPMGSLIPEKIDNFLVADKNISVSNIVNGTTRLQPVVLGIGQAAGAIAGQAIKDDLNTSSVSIRKVQQALLDQNVYLIPFMDVPSSDSTFSSIQKIGVCGILKGVGVPFKWANETWFYPEQIVSEYELKKGLLPLYPNLFKIHASGQAVTPTFLVTIFDQLKLNVDIKMIENQWAGFEMSKSFSKTVALDRRAVSVLLDHFLNPFELDVNFEGDVTTNSRFEK